MTAVVTQGPEAARDVCSCFDLNKKALYALVTKRDSKVRTPSVTVVVHSSIPFGRLWWWFFLLSSLGPHTAAEVHAFE